MGLRLATSGGAVASADGYLAVRSWLDGHAVTLITTDTTDPASGQQIIKNTRPFCLLESLDITRCFVWMRDNLTLTDWNAWALPYIKGILNAQGPNEGPDKERSPMQKDAEPDARKSRMLGRTRAYTRPGMQMLVHRTQPDLTVAPDRPTKAADDCKTRASQKRKKKRKGNSSTGYRGVRPSRSRLRRVCSFVCLHSRSLSSSSA